MRRVVVVATTFALLAASAVASVQAATFTGGSHQSAPPLFIDDAAGTIQSLSLKPKAFRAVNGGGAIFSRRGAPVGTTVTYLVSAPTTVEFTVERRTSGRRVGEKCEKTAAANRDRKKCALFRPLKPTFTHFGVDNGIVPGNRFKFSGRIGEKALKPGTYRLTGEAGGSVRRALFRILR